MDEIFDRIWQRKFYFLGTFFVVFTLSYLMLAALDFLPEPTKSNVNQPEKELLSIKETETASAQSIEPAVDINDPTLALPVKIEFVDLDKTVEVLNPASQKVADLDTALLSGVVRHPASATLTQEGNVFILGHSSYLPNVVNKNFQAFNGIQKLEWGSIIKVYSAGAVYTYRVEKVYQATAQDLVVPIAGSGKHLTLATCNSFGTKDDRFVVEAKQIAVESIANVK